ncbi:MAG: TonB family protein [Campylobacterota bacterium]|nr:TonB family protein [Campylobacterota bacterium]
MNRYILSFFITTILYSSLFAALFYNYNKTTKLESKSSKSNQSVKFTIISKAKTTTQKKVKKSEKKIIKKPKIKKKIEKKIKKKTIKKTPTKPIKKVETKKLKKPITPKKIEKQDIQKPIQKVKKDIPKKIVKKQTPSPKQIKQQIKQNKSKNEQKILNDNQKQQTKIKQNQYYSKIKNIIFKNKRYPKIAIRRGIESSVKVDFTISKDGKLLSFDIINGNKIFKNSIKDAITKSFPLTPPKGLFVTNINLSITIEYKLY